MQQLGYKDKALINTTDRVFMFVMFSLKEKQQKKKLSVKYTDV